MIEFFYIVCKTLRLITELFYAVPYSKYESVGNRLYVKFNSLTNFTTPHITIAHV